MTRTIHFGAGDWRHPEWAGSFYPEDMPEEWRLAYYNTQFSCVWLARQVWQTATPDDVAGWTRDVGKNFKFLLEANTHDIARFEALSKVVNSDALVIADADLGIIWFDAQTELGDLTSRLRTTPESVPVYLVSRDANLDTLTQVSILLELLGL
jgi:hypothetical protein